MGALLIGAGVLVATVAISYLVDGLRSAPATPERLSWAPDIPIQSADVDGVRLRYIVTGEGPPLLLLHTLRTQLDMFQKVIPQLARTFRVYALDLPGHGYSGIPAAELTPGLFTQSVAGFLDRLGLEGVTVVGESIGGTIGLLLGCPGQPAGKSSARDQSLRLRSRAGASASQPAGQRRPGVGCRTGARPNRDPAEIASRRATDLSRRSKPEALVPAGSDARDVRGGQSPGLHERIRVVGS